MEKPSEMQKQSFFESTLGKMVLGFFFTTAAGTILTFIIQHLTWTIQLKQECVDLAVHQRNEIQEDLLTLAAVRYHYTGMVVDRLTGGHTPASDSQGHIDYWMAKLSPVKDEWNEKIVIYNSKLKLLYGEEVASMLMSNESLYREYKYNNDYQTSPTSLQEAFEHVHETAYFLLFKCKGNTETCPIVNRDNQPIDNWDGQWLRAKQELTYLNKKIGELADTLGRELFKAPAYCK